MTEDEEIIHITDMVVQLLAAEKTAGATMKPSDGKIKELTELVIKCYKTATIAYQQHKV